jgi:hypothetical protein
MDRHRSGHHPADAPGHRRQGGSQPAHARSRQRLTEFGNDHIEVEVEVVPGAGHAVRRDCAGAYPQRRFSPLSGMQDVPENYHLRYELKKNGDKTHVLLSQDKNASDQEDERAKGNWKATDLRRSIS